MLNQLFIRPCVCLVLMFCVAISAEKSAMAEGNPEHLLLEKSSTHSDVFLDFHSAKPGNFVWFLGQKPASNNMDKYGVFNSVTLQTLGYDPGNRDHLESRF